MTEVKNNAPEVVSESLMQTAEQELNAYGWLLVQESVTGESMVA